MIEKKKRFINDIFEKIRALIGKSVFSNHCLVQHILMCMNSATSEGDESD